MRKRLTCSSAGTRCLRGKAPILTVALSLLIAVGCGGDDEPKGDEAEPPVVEEPEPLPAEGLLVSYAREGGIAFSRYAIRINADGTGSGGPAAGTEEDVDRFLIKPEEVDRLRELLDQNRLPEEQEFEQSCPDCFIYTIGYGEEEFEWDQLTGPPERYADVIRFVRKLAPIPIRSDDGLPPEGTDGLLLSYTRSGGISQPSSSLEILADGRVTSSPGNGIVSASTKRIELPRRDLLDLREALKANPIDDFGDPDLDEDCADCLSYSLAFGGERYDWDDSASESVQRNAVLDAIRQLPIPK